MWPSRLVRVLARVRRRAADPLSSWTLRAPGSQLASETSTPRGRIEFLSVPGAGRRGRGPGMSCNSRDITLYVDGELSPSEAARVRAHAASCAACAAMLVQEQDLDRALGGLGDFAAPDGFADRTVLRARCDLTHAVTSPRELGRAAAFVASLGGAAVLLLWPTGLLSPVAAAMGPLRCFSRFAVAWAANSFTGALIVGRTLSAHLLADGRLPLAAALALLAALVALLGALLARYHRDVVHGGRGRAR